jgi:hypothetical protein
MIRAPIRSFASSWLTALVVATTLAGLTASAAHAAAVDDVPEKVLQSVLDAHKSGAYKDFAALLEPKDDGRVGVTPEMFERMSTRLAPRLQAGYRAQFLGKLRQQGTLYLWKLEFTDGKDDLLVRMSMKDGKISVILFQF